MKKRSTRNSRFAAYSKAAAPVSVRAEPFRLEPAPLFWLIFPAVILFFALFFPLVFRSEQFLYRDAGKFYYPLFAQIQTELSAGRLPLWDPYENLGQPLLGNPTSSVFYPGKLIFFLPSILPVSYGVCYKWYIFLHLPLAFAGLYRLTRSWGRSPAASVFGALTYTFCAPILFQYCNVIFLVGAAWLPWAVLYGDRLLTRRGMESLLKLAAVLAFMSLAGDIQTAYMTGMILFMLYLYRRREGVSVGADVSAEREKTVGFARWNRPLILLICAGVLGGVLSSVSLIPARAMGKRTDRSDLLSPISIWDIPKYAADRANPPDAESEVSFLQGVMRQIRSLKSTGTRIVDGLFCRELRSGNHQGDHYRFSVGPMRAVEFLWPKFAGDYMRGDTYWRKNFQNEERWNPTLYFGVVPFLLLLCSFRLRKKRSPDALADSFETPRRWASAVTLIFFLTSWGAFGPCWFARFFSLLGGTPQNLAFSNWDPVGGIDWLFNVLLPFYCSFRYPAKMLTVAALGAAVLSADGFDRALDFKRFRFFSAAAIFLSFAAFALFRVFGDSFLRSLCDVTKQTDLDVDATVRVVSLSFVQPAVILGLFALLIRFARGGGMARRFFAPAAVALLAIDLYFSSASFFPHVPESEIARTAPIAETIRRDAAESNALPEIPIRFYSIHDTRFPRALTELRGDRRDAIVQRWDRETLTPKLSQLEGLNAFPVPGTTLGGDMRLLGIQTYGRFVRLLPNPEKIVPLLALYDVRYAVLSDAIAAGIPEEKRLLLEPESLPLETVLWKNPEPCARIRIVRDESKYPKVYDVADLFKPLTVSPPEEPRDGEYVQITRYLPNQIEWNLRLTSPASVIVADQFWPGWKTIAYPLQDGREGKGVKISIREDYLRRRMEFPAGEFRCVMTYRPMEVYGSLILTLIAWLGMAGISIWLLIKKSKQFNERKWT